MLCEEVTAANDTRAYQACVLCPGFFGEICAFHAMDHPFGQHTGGLRGAEGPGWSKGPRTSPGTHAATRSADLEFLHELSSTNLPFSRLQTDAVLGAEGSGRSQDSSISPSILAAFRSAKLAFVHCVGLPACGVPMLPKDFLYFRPPAAEYLGAEGSSRSQGPSISPSILAKSRSDGVQARWNANSSSVDDSGSHVGLLAYVAACWTCFSDAFSWICNGIENFSRPSRQRNHSPLVGVRIGEASHPGPYWCLRL